jgi:hypothetical protein
MNNLRRFFLWLLLAAFAPATSAQPAISCNDDLPAAAPLARRVAVGMTRGGLLLAAGAPDAVLDAKVWVYWDFRVDAVPADDRHDALLVVFKGERIEFFKFCPGQPVRAFLARQRAAARNSVATK